MSWPLMMLVGVIYLLAMIGYAYEGKYAWSIVVGAWAISNFALAYVSTHGTS